MSFPDTLIAFFWPRPPAAITDESKTALDADLKASRGFGATLGDGNRMGVDVWTRHADNLARSENRAYLRAHARTFAARWACLALGAWGVAWLAEGLLWIEAPMVLFGTAAGIVTMAFWYAYRRLNRGQD